MIEKEVVKLDMLKHSPMNRIVCAICGEIGSLTTHTPYYYVPLLILTRYNARPHNNIVCHKCYQRMYDDEYKSKESIKESVQKLIRLAGKERHYVHINQSKK